MTVASASGGSSEEPEAAQRTRKTPRYRFIPLLLIPWSLVVIVRPCIRPTSRRLAIGLPTRECSKNQEVGHVATGLRTPSTPACCPVFDINRHVDGGCFWIFPTVGLALLTASARTRPLVSPRNATRCRRRPPIVRHCRDVDSGAPGRNRQSWKANGV